MNTFFLIVVMVWIQTGFAMVILSAAIKGVPTEMIEAAGWTGRTPGNSSATSPSRPSAAH